MFVRLLLKIAFLIFGPKTQTAVYAAVWVVDLLKTLPVGEWAANLAARTPNTWDDRLVARLRRVVPDALEALGFASEAVSDPVFVEDALKGRKGDGLKHVLASEIARRLSDGKLGKMQADVLTQVVYGVNKVKTDGKVR